MLEMSKGRADLRAKVGARRADFAVSGRAARSVDAHRVACPATQVVRQFPPAKDPMVGLSAPAEAFGEG
jgi:hypothetical protein